MFVRRILIASVAALPHCLATRSLFFQYVSSFDLSCHRHVPLVCGQFFADALILNSDHTVRSSIMRFVNPTDLDLIFLSSLI